MRLKYTQNAPNMSADAFDSFLPMDHGVCFTHTFVKAQWLKTVSSATVILPEQLCLVSLLKPKTASFKVYWVDGFNCWLHRKPSAPVEVIFKRSFHYTNTTSFAVKGQSLCPPMAQKPQHTQPANQYKLSRPLSHVHTCTQRAFPFWGSVFPATSAESQSACFSLRLCDVLIVSMPTAITIRNATTAPWGPLSPCCLPLGERWEGRMTSRYAHR